MTKNNTPPTEKIKLIREYSKYQITAYTTYIMGGILNIYLLYNTTQSTSEPTVWHFTPFICGLLLTVILWHKDPKKSESPSFIDWFTNHTPDDYSHLSAKEITYYIDYIKLRENPSKSTKTRQKEKIGKLGTVICTVCILTLTSGFRLGVVPKKLTIIVGLLLILLWCIYVMIWSKASDRQNMQRKVDKLQEELATRERNQ